MEASQLLLEYLKEQYAQARQHENRQTAATTFLTAASAAILGLTIKQGTLTHENWWAGAAVCLLGLANLAIIDAHFTGNRFHTKLAGKVRGALENRCEDWGTTATTTQLRSSALAEMNLSGPDVSIGGLVNEKLKRIPQIMILIGAVVALLAWCS